MTEPIPMPDRQEPVVIEWGDVEAEVESLTSGEGGAIGAVEDLTAEDLQGAKQVGKRFLANLNHAFDHQKAGETQRGRKSGWLSIVIPLIEAGIATGVEMLQAGKKAKK